MKKLILALSFTLIFTSFFAQGYFEKKGKKMSPNEFALGLSDGPTRYDYYRFLGEKKITLYVDEYSSKLMYNDFDINKKLKKLSTEEKVEIYNSIWSQAFEESFLNTLVDFKIETKDIATLSNEEKEKSLFLSYKQYFGLDYAVLWFFNDDMQESILTYTFIKSFDMVDKNEIRLMLNFLYTSIAPNTDKAVEKYHEEFNDAISTNEKGAKKREKIGTVFASEESQDNINEYIERQTVAFLEKNGSYTLLIPEEIKDEDKEEALKKWKYSDYRIVSKSEIDKARNERNPNIVYVKPVNFMLGSKLIYLISSSDEVLYSSSYSKLGNNHSLFESLILELEEKETRLINKSGSMTYHKLSFKQETLPKDLINAKIVFVRMKESEHRKYKLYNKYFEQEMEKYPYKYEIVDELPSDYDYRIYIKRTMSPLKKTTYSSNNSYGAHGNNHNVSNGTSFGARKTSVDYSSVEDFYVYIESKKTGELYKTPERNTNEEIISTGSDLFIREARNFVKEAKKLSKEKNE